MSEFANEQRAHRGRRGVRLMAVYRSEEYGNGEHEEAYIDAIADIGHAATAAGFDIKELCRIACQHVSTEVAIATRTQG